MSEGLTHLDGEGRARMVDTGAKRETERRATAEGIVRLDPSTLARIVHGDVPKGDVLAAARLAGIQGAKRTPDLVPLCHPIRLTSVAVSFDPREDTGELLVTATASAVDRTGVEMEALTAVTAAALCVYDMVKAIDRSASIDGVRLLAKSGGKSGDWTRAGA